MDPSWKQQISLQGCIGLHLSPVFFWFSQHNFLKQLFCPHFSHPVSLKAIAVSLSLLHPTALLKVIRETEFSNSVVNLQFLFYWVYNHIWHGWWPFLKYVLFLALGHCPNYCLSCCMCPSSPFLVRPHLPSCKHGSAQCSGLRAMLLCVYSHSFSDLVHNHGFQLSVSETPDLLSPAWTSLLSPRLMVSSCQLSHLFLYV